MKLYKKVFYISLTSMIVLTIVNTVVFALSTNDITVSYPTYGFYLKGNPITYAVTINGDENNPSTVKVYYPYNTYNSQPRVLLKTLSRNGNYYSGTSSPTTWVPGKKSGSHGLWETRGFCIQATKEGTTVKKGIWISYRWQPEFLYKR